MLPRDPAHVTHRLPKWGEVRELVQFRKVHIDPVARRLANAWTVEDLRRIAKRTTPRGVFDYVDGAAEEEITIARNADALHEATLTPRALVDVSRPALGTRVLGQDWALPFGFGPTGYTRMMHHHGEASVARVAAQAGVPYTLSTVGTSTIEQVRAAAPDANLWFQLYVTGDHELNATLVRRAQAAGCSTLMVTVDTTVGGARLRDNYNGLTIPPSLTAKTFANMALHPYWWFHKLTTDPITFASLASATRMSSEEIANHIFDPTLDADLLRTIRDLWPGPLVVKGVLSPESALAARAAGADGVVVSNHGGRQLDRAPATLDVLPAIRAAVGDDYPVLLDSGIRHGYDIAVALAAGADAVLLGRAYLYAIMAGGEPGVRRLVELLAQQYQRCLQLLGVPRTDDLSRDDVRLRTDPPAGDGAREPLTR